MQISNLFTMAANNQDKAVSRAALETRPGAFYQHNQAQTVGGSDDAASISNLGSKISSLLNGGLDRASIEKAYPSIDRFLPQASSQAFDAIENAFTKLPDDADTGASILGTLKSRFALDHTLAQPGQNGKPEFNEAYIQSLINESVENNNHHAEYNAMLTNVLNFFQEEQAV